MSPQEIIKLLSKQLEESDERLKQIILTNENINKLNCLIKLLKAVVPFDPNKQSLHPIVENKIKELINKL